MTGLAIVSFNVWQKTRGRETTTVATILRKPLDATTLSTHATADDTFSGLNERLRQLIMNGKCVVLAAKVRSLKKDHWVQMRLLTLIKTRHTV